MRALFASGFAFDDDYANTRSAHDCSVVAEPWTLRSAQAWDQTSAWEIAPPCTLPERTRMLRTEGGKLVLCHDSDLVGTGHMEMPPPTRVRMGIVSFPARPPCSFSYRPLVQTTKLSQRA